eukprot:maker-scaffold41_size498431-snap-gene-0.12 protein:Tk00186 transcript:maker-scaffold41_size498431-snap-gene-0.12-mRNA-1 annotation:"proteasome activator complex subunit 4"
MMEEDFDEDFDDPLSEELDESLPTRSQALGFEPQKEIIYNGLLPYSHLMDLEARQSFVQIKSHLCQALALREIRPAGLIWMTRLSKYMRHYGFLFTLEDHLDLIHIILEVLFLPECDPFMVNKAAGVLVFLLKRKELIEPQHLTLPWRPFHDLYEKLMFSPFEHMGMLLNPSTLGKHLRTLNRLVRVYFPPEATQEILDEIRSLMCPYDVTMGKAVAYAEMFLPTYNSTPVGNKHMVGDMTSVVRWIVSTMGEGSSSLRYLQQMVLAIETYFNAANIGRHSAKLTEFLWRLAQSFMRRIHRERYAKPKWGMDVDPTKRLTDEDITTFVKCLKPIALASLFSHTGMMDQGLTIQILTTLRPEIMLPPVLEKMNSALGTLTEPHKLTASLHAMSSVSRSLIYPGENFPEGPTHVIPLMMACLPGIDPNDVRKSMVTIQFLSIYSTLIPLVDCSQASQHYSDLTEEEREVCCQSAQFEDFVAEFLQRCFALIESSTFHQTREEVSEHRHNMEDSMKDVGLASTFSTILFQSSEAIYDMALKKVHSFVNGRILETKVAGKMTSSLCRALCKVRPEKGLKAFVPTAIKSITNLLTDHTQTDETLDDELKFNMLILAECLRSPGDHVLPYVPQVETILHQTLHIKNKDGRLLAVSMLKNLLHSITALNMTDFRSVPEGYDRPLKEFLPIRAWGLPGKIHDLQVKWHIPNGEELASAQHLIDTMLGKELEDLEKYANNELTLAKEELQAKFDVIQGILQGCGYVLPLWTDEEKHIPLFESQVNCEPLPVMTTHPKEMELNFRGANARLAILRVIDLVQAKLMANVEDDTKSLQSIIAIYRSLVLFIGIGKETYDSRYKSYKAVKLILDNKLVGCRKQIRVLIIDRIQLQHEGRMTERNSVPYTKSHTKVLENLFTLSTSHYSQVRCHAQDVLGQCMGNFNSGYLELIPKALEFLQNDPNVSHEQFKGALYIILACGGRKTLLAKHDWKVMRRVWPIMVDAQHSEKPSIVHLLDKLVGAMFKSMPTFALTYQVPDSLVEKCRHFWNNASPLKPEGVFPQAAQLEMGVTKLAEWNQSNKVCYHELVKDLCDRLESGKLHWRHYNMAVSMLCVLCRSDESFPEQPVRILVNDLIHENITVRKGAHTLVGCILKQQKRNHPKIEIHPVANPEVPPKWPGDREDNHWMCYDSKALPKSSLFRNFGDSFLPLIRPHLERLMEEDKESSSRCVAEILASLIRGTKHWPFEMVEDMWTWVVPIIRKALTKVTIETFADWGTCFATASESRDPFRIHWMLEVLMEDPLRSQGSFIDTSRLFAIQGSLSQQEWRAGELMHRLLNFLKPFLTHPYQNVRERIGSVLTSIFIHDLEFRSQEDGVKSQSKRCPNVGDFLNEILPQLDILREEPDPAVVTFQMTRQPQAIPNHAGMIPIGSDGLPMLQMGPGGMPPMMLGPNGEPLALMGPNGQPIAIPPGMMPMMGSGSGPPMMRPGSNMPAIRGGEPSQFMPTGPPKGVSDLPPPLPEPMDIHLSDAKALEYETRQIAIRLLQTTARFLNGSLTRAFNGAKPEVFKLLPVLCNNEANEFEPNLARDCKMTLATMASMIIPLETIPNLIAGVKDVLTLSSWKANCSALQVLEVSVFMNLPSLLSRPDWMGEIVEIATKSLESERIEIREKAGQFLCGLLHCDFVSDGKRVELLESFKSKARTKLNKRKKVVASEGAEAANQDLQADEARKQKAILKRHIGVIGLSAFVAAYPYDVPEYVPDILMILSDKVHDPQPIPTTVKKTLMDFKRTHQDNWEEHKLKFSEDQLSILTDLLVSPSYYA